MTDRNRFFIPRPDMLLGSRYELLECLGDGSHGWVWRAQRLEDHQIVAVKIPKEQGANNIDLAEGKRLVGKVSHPNVISVYWMGRVPPEREWYAIEMEYFPSLTLAQLLEQGDQGFVASYNRILELYQQVLAGVEHLHSLGMVHGDIKPQNVLVSGHQIKITDFGSSIDPDEIYVRTRHNGGTVLYSAPEVAGTTTWRHKARAFFPVDIYSLGVMLYHLVTSRLPHDTLSQVVRHTPFPRPREINRSVSPALEDFILRCLALLPEDRWSSVTEMGQVFRKVKQAQLDYQPVRTYSPRNELTEDWSSQAIRLLSDEHYIEAENVAYAEFQASRDPYAFLLMVSAAYQDGRYFDCIRELERCPKLLSACSPVKRDLRHIALSSYIETRNITRAHQLIEELIEEEGQTSPLLIKKASLLALEAHYEEAAKILLTLNKEHPGQPAIQKRLVLVYEQLRDIGKAAAFLKAYIRQLPNDRWAIEKLEQFEAIGIP